MADRINVNPFLKVMSLFSIPARKTAGYWGPVRFALPIVGTPWQWWTGQKQANVAPHLTA